MKERKKKRPNQTTTVSLVTHDAPKEWDGGLDEIPYLDSLSNDVEASRLLRRRAERSPDL
jgi:hypothetical protein